MKDEMKLTDMDSIKAFSDPYKLKILNTFHRLGRPATSKEIADKMGEVPSKVYYHVKILEKHDIISLVYTKEINGIVAKYYEPTADSYIIDNQEYEEIMPNAPHIRNQYERVISNIFNDGKEQYIEAMREKKDTKRDGVICSDIVYLTDDEYLAFKEYIKTLSKVKDDNGNKGTKPYLLFSSIIDIKDKDR